MTCNVQDVFVALNTQRSTLVVVEQMLSFATRENLRLVSDNCFNFDQARIDAIRDFLLVERQEVQDTINSLLGLSVSGC